MAATVLIDARDAYAPQLRGWGRYARRLVEAVQAGAPAELDVTVLRNGGRGPEVLFEQLKLPLILRKRAVGLLHSPNCFLPLWRPCPGVVTIHDLAFEAYREDFSRMTGAKYRALTPRAARSAERIICPSHFTRDDLCARYGVEPAKTRVIPEAPALPVGSHPTPEGPYIVAVGDLRLKKNFAALVSAVVELRAREGVPHRLVIAGLDCGEGPRLRRLADAASLELTGYITDEQLDALIRGADVLVHPSLYEGFGLVILEAMARGVPVVAARASALPETGGSAAAYFSPAEPESLRDALWSLISDPAARSELASRGVAWARQFSWERTARETLRVYEELL